MIGCFWSADSHTTVEWASDNEALTKRLNQQARPIVGLTVSILDQAKAKASSTGSGYFMDIVFFIVVINNIVFQNYFKLTI